MTRAYTLAEIDRMRDAVRDSIGMSANPSAIEERLRTYMIGNIEPFELEIAMYKRRYERWRTQLIEHGPNKMVRGHYPLLQMRKFIFKIEAIKARNGC